MRRERIDEAIHIGHGKAAAARDGPDQIDHSTERIGERLRRGDPRIVRPSGDDLVQQLTRISQVVHDGPTLPELLGQRHDRGQLPRRPRLDGTGRQQRYDEEHHRVRVSPDIQMTRGASSAEHPRALRAILLRPAEP